MFSLHLRLDATLREMNGTSFSTSYWLEADELDPLVPLDLLDPLGIWGLL